MAKRFEPTSYTIALGMVIARLREDRCKATQVSLCRLMPLSTAMLSRVELGMRRDVEELLPDIATALYVDAREIKRITNVALALSEKSLRVCLPMALTDSYPWDRKVEELVGERGLRAFIQLGVALAFDREKTLVEG